MSCVSLSFFSECLQNLISQQKMRGNENSLNCQKSTGKYYQCLALQVNSAVSKVDLLIFIFFKCKVATCACYIIRN